MTCCNKNCNQGKNCPARQACELPEPEQPPKPIRCPALVYLLGALFWALVLLWVSHG
jgi:hypothetical protein